jgi:hypothetical protein
MTIDVLGELRRVGHGYPAKAPPIPVAMTGVGTIGHIENRRGLYLNSAIERHVHMLVREHNAMEMAARDVSNGVFGADDLLPIIAKGSDTRDAIRAIKSMRGAIASYNDIISARGSGTKSWDLMAGKANTTVIANAWQSYITLPGTYGIGAYSDIPGPPAWSASDAGAWPLGPVSLGASEELYLTSIGANVPTGSNVMLAVDILTANGSIVSSIVTSQNVSSTTLPRWTGGAGVMMTLEVTTNLSTSTGIPNITVNYTDQDGNAGASSTVTMGITNAVAQRLLPIKDGPMMRLGSGDYGVRSIQQYTQSISTAGGGGRLALLQYKPIIFLPSLIGTMFVERSTPVDIGGIKKLTSVPQGSLPYIGFFALPSVASTGQYLYILETAWG